MKSGTLIGVGFGLVALIAGVAIFALDGVVYYHRAPALDEIEIGGQSFAVSGYDGLENETLPLRLRGCFRLADPDAALVAGDAAPGAEPFGAPFWFECWDAARIDADLKRGAARAVVAETLTQGEFVFERVVVIYPSGEAYQWRRLVEGG